MMNNIGMINIRDILELQMIKQQTIDEIRELIKYKDTIKAQEKVQDSIKTVAESTDDTPTGIVSKGPMALKLHIKGQQEFSEDSVGAFQRQSLC